ncbi:MAG TPA: ROK family protein, partial [Alphaproteobacteria bacterium]|nr:ROK family protein [Alphaproteobacteria bacterium]
NHGCLEVYASLRGPLAEAEKHFGRPMRIADVVALAQEGDEVCRNLIRRAAEAGGRGLGIIGSVFNPPLIVISGGLERAGDLLLEPLAQSFERYGLIKRDDVPDATRTILRPSRFPENGACMGAVGLVLRHHGRLH